MRSWGHFKVTRGVSVSPPGRPQCHLRVPSVTSASPEGFSCHLEGPRVTWRVSLSPWGSPACPHVPPGGPCVTSESPGCHLEGLIVTLGVPWGHWEGSWCHLRVTWQVLGLLESHLEGPSVTWGSSCPQLKVPVVTSVTWRGSQGNFEVT